MLWNFLQASKGEPAYFYVTDVNEFPSLQHRADSQIHILHCCPVLPAPSIINRWNPPDTSCPWKMNIALVRLTNSRSFNFLSLIVELCIWGTWCTIEAEEWVHRRSCLLLILKMVVQRHFLESCQQTFIRIDCTYGSPTLRTSKVYRNISFLSAVKLTFCIRDRICTNQISSESGRGQSPDCARGTE